MALLPAPRVTPVATWRNSLQSKEGEWDRNRRARVQRILHLPVSCLGYPEEANIRDLTWLGLSSRMTLGDMLLAFCVQEPEYTKKGT